MIKLFNKTIPRVKEAKYIVDQNINKRTNQEIGHVHFPRWENMTSMMTAKGKRFSTIPIGRPEQEASTKAKRW